MGESLAFEAALNASNFLSGINQMVQGMNRVEQSGSSVSGGLAASLGGQKGKFSSIGSEIGNTLTQSLGSSFGSMGGVATSLAGALGPVGIAAGLAGAALIGAGVASVQAAAQFETAMAGAKKVISLTPETDSGAYFQKLGQDIGILSTTVPVAATELAGLAGVAGSLGVGQDSIMGFVESASQMSVAWEMPAEAAGTAAAKILNAFQQPINTQNMQSLGNVINQIGDSMAATESEVLDFTNRASFLNTTMGLSVSQVAALGGVLISAGLTAETAAGGLKSAMNSLTSTTSKTGGMDNWAKLMGVSVDELTAKVAGDLPNTLIETANKIAAIEDPVARFQMAVQMAGSEGAVALLKLAGQQEAYNSVLEKSISQWDKGQAGEKGGMAKTFEANSQTFNAQMQLVSNAATFAGVAIGNLLLPALTSIAGGFAGLIAGAVQAGQALGGIVSNSALFTAIGAAATSLGSIVTAVFGNMAALFTPIWTALGGGSAAMGVLAAAFDLVTAPATLLYEGISTLAGAFASAESSMEPLASLLGGTLGSAISQASSVIQALGEVISETVTKSETFKTIVTVIEGAKAGISSAIDAIKGFFSGMFDGLDVESTLGKILDSVIDLIKNSELGQLISSVMGSDFFTEVATRAQNIEGQKQAAIEAGNQVAEAEADAIAKNEKLKSAGEEAIKLALDNENTMKAAKEAGEKVSKEFWDANDAYAKTYGGGIAAGLSTAEINNMEKNTAGYQYQLDLAKRQAREEGERKKLGYERFMLPVAGAELDQSHYIVLRQLGGAFEDATVKSSEYLTLSGENWKDTTGDANQLFETIKTGFGLSDEEAAASMQLMMGYGDTVDVNKQKMRNMFGTSMEGWKQEHSNLIMAEEDAKKVGAAYEDAFRIEYKKGLFSGWVASLEPEMRDAGESLGWELWDSMQTKLGSETKDVKVITDFWQSILEGLGTADWSKLDGFIADLNKKVHDNLLTEEDAKKTADLYMDALTKAVYDAGLLATDQMEGIGSEITAALEKGIKPDEALVPKMNLFLDWLKATYPAEFEKIGGLSWEAMADAIASGDIEKIKAAFDQLVAIGQLKGEETGKGFVSAMFGAMKEGFENRTLLEQLNAGGAITDPSAWRANTFIPSLKKDFDEYNAQFKLGTDQSLKATQEWVDMQISIHKQYAEYLPKWFNQLIDMYEQGPGVLSLQELMDVLDGILNTATDKTTAATKKQSVGYDNLKKTIEDCADCAISEFGAWQEAQDNLFSGSYIGEGGQPYLDWKEDSIAAIRETQQAMDKVGGAVLGKRYTGPEYDWVDENKKTIELTVQDQDFKTKIGVCDDTLETLKNKAKTVGLDGNFSPFMDGLDAAISAVPSSITIDVYYNEVNSPSYGPAPDILNEGIFSDDWANFPSYDSGTDYVPFDQFAKIHKGEAVLTASENQSRSSGGSISVTIGPTIIEGDVNGVDDFEERMDRRDKELLKKMNSALKSMAKAS